MHITKKGYVQIHRHTYEHRYVFEQHYKCCILPWGEIHHRNGIKTDNRIENLEGMIQLKHKRLHMMGNQFSKKDMNDRFCKICGSTTTAMRSSTGWPQWFEIEGGYMCRKCKDKIRYKNKKK